MACCEKAPAECLAAQLWTTRQLKIALTLFAIATAVKLEPDMIPSF
jgi:hypothetical protein